MMYYRYIRFQLNQIKAIKQYELFMTKLFDQLCLLNCNRTNQQFSSYSTLTFSRACSKGFVSIISWLVGFVINI